MTKKWIALALSLLMLLSLLTACQQQPQIAMTEETAAPKAEQIPAPTPESSPEPSPEPTDEPNLPWQKAFRSNKLQEGEITPNEIAFYTLDEDGNAFITNVPKEEVYAGQPERLPRSRYLEQFLPDKLLPVLPVMDYALTHGYSRFCIPTTDFNYGDLNDSGQILARMYRVDGNGVNGLDIKRFTLENGETMTYVLITFSGLSTRQQIERYLAGYAAAEEIVASVPTDSTELETALYLYRYLTESVEYDFGDYYEEAHELLLYDTLILNSTVCAGYTEALYYLYNLAGIDCLVIEGYITGPSPLGGHIWNIARINGQYYQFDATWDTRLTVEEYDFFAVSDDYMVENHTKYVSALDQQIDPPCPESLFPAMELDYEAIERSNSLLFAYYYCGLEALTVNNPVRVFSYATGLSEEYLGLRDAGDGWIIADNIPYSRFINTFRSILSDDLAEEFCAGLFESRNGRAAVDAAKGNGNYHRLLRLTENDDGSVLAEMCEIDREGTVTPFELLITLANGRVASVERR